MANALYPIWKQALLSAGTNSRVDSGATATPRVTFVDTGTYTYSAAHDFYNDLSGVYPATRATGGALNSRTVTAGTFDAADVTFSAFSNGSVSVEGLIIYIDDASADNTSRLVAYLDTSITGLPFTPSGSDVTIQWDSNGIFTL
jgi:hypothetical protein